MFNGIWKDDLGISLNCIKEIKCQIINGRQTNLFFNFLKYCSKNISIIYVVQWLLIFWSFPLTGYLSLGFIHTLYWMAGISLTTFLLTYDIKKNL